MSQELISKVDIIKDRAAMFFKCRSFFEQRKILEVDVPILSTTASIDAHIDLVQATICGKNAFLHSSPEYGMKRLLADGIGDIYQISHVFRDNERGKRHTVEFVMVEWYRMGFTLQHMLNETIEFIRLFLDTIPKEYEIFTYREAFIHFAGFYPHSMEERDRIYAFEVEPHFGRETITVVNEFPPEQAALSCIGKNGNAERFEMYFRGMELANGYHELADPFEQRKRLDSANNERIALGKQKLPVDEDFVEALTRGIPDCCGVAVGFDRLMMLRHQLEEIRDASCFFI